ncbi:hypothetical protein CRE_15904 [Caenorhabditis remanei]|uniref:Serpentine receptor class gamma n=1 Tax=Caenorhabditis remanei TaxID=31234 RepID=E3MBG0_CAERE|nr:hypothetical protein CRE_15904 [Caenorhabditis remanei]
MIVAGIWVCYGVPSFFLVIFFLFFLGKPEFKYSFYRVLQCDMTINILCYLNTWISRLYHIETTIPFMIWVHDNAYFVFRVYRFFVNYYHSAQSLSVIIMAAHRFWSSKSTSSNRFWSVYYGHVYLGLAVTSVILTIPNVFLGLYAVDYYDRETGVFVINRLTADKVILGNFTLMTKSLIFFAIIFVLSISTLYLLQKRFPYQTSSLQVKTMMKNLTTIAFMNSFLFFVVLLWPIIISIFVTLSGEFQYNAIMFLSDVLSLSLPYILMAFDKNVQTTMSKMMDSWGPRVQHSGSFTMQRRSNFL